MASPDVLDFERLLAPISEESPGGVELRSDPAATTLFFQVKDARDSARAAERSLLAADDDEAESAESPDWYTVRNQCEKVLAETSKDLWVAAWLIEALCRLEGFAGLRDGFRLVKELAENFWDGIHPEPDEDGYVTTVAQLTGLNGDDGVGVLLAPIHQIEMTQEGTYRAFSSGDYAQAADLAQVTDPDRKQARIDRGAITIEMFEKAATETSVGFFRTLISDIEETRSAFAEMNAVLEERCGQNEDGYSAAPPSSAINSALQEYLDRVMAIAGPALELDDAANASAEEGEEGEEGGGSGGGGGGPGRMATREDAFRTLLEVASFFRRTEPHSPLSYTLEQVVRWGRMPLPELLQELVVDESALDSVFTRTGIPRRPEE